MGLKGLKKIEPFAYQGFKKATQCRLLKPLVLKLNTVSLYFRCNYEISEHFLVMQVVLVHFNICSAHGTTVPLAIFILSLYSNDVSILIE